MRKIEMLDRRFGRLTVTAESGKDGKGVIIWKCLCDCGTIHTARGTELRNGDITSCGCFQREGAAIRTRTHGLSKTPTHKAWYRMISRCTHKSREDYFRYGGRGIAVCSRWLEPNGQGFLNFLSDMGEIPDGMSLDRINNDLGYSPENCRWADNYTQAQNQSTTVHISFNGKTLCMAEWARELGYTRSYVAVTVKRMGGVEAIKYLQTRKRQPKKIK